MFLVKAYEDLPDGTRKRFVTLERVEEKLGHHGSVTAALSFDRAPAQLIGKRGEGFKYMLVLMNNARVGVGFESIGLAEAATRMASAYAEERRSMGKAIARHEMIADLLDEMRTDVQALRALAVTSAFHEEMAQKLALFQRFASLATPEERARIEHDLPQHRAASRRFTPLLKYLAAEKAVEIARRNMQIHGGVGYTREFGAEKLLRDALVLPIYEGTSQIQSLMAMKDTLLGIVKRPRAFVAKLGRGAVAGAVGARSARARASRASRPSRCRRSSTSSRAPPPASSARSPTCRSRSGSASSRKEWDPKRDFALAMLHAERLTRLLADEADRRDPARSGRSASRSAASSSSASSIAPSAGVARCTRRSRRAATRVLASLAAPAPAQRGGGVERWAPPCNTSSSRAPVLAALGRVGHRGPSSEAGRRRDRHARPAGSRRSSARAPTRSCATTSASCGGDPGAYRGRVPRALLPAVGLPARRARARAPPLPLRARRERRLPHRAARAVAGRRAAARAGAHRVDRRRRAPRARHPARRDRDGAARPRPSSRRCACSCRSARRSRAALRRRRAEGEGARARRRARDRVPAA